MPRGKGRPGNNWGEAFRIIGQALERQEIPFGKTRLRDYGKGPQTFPQDSRNLEIIGARRGYNDALKKVGKMTPAQKATAKLKDFFD